jgi:hypothetical protein
MNSLSTRHIFSAGAIIMLIAPLLMAQTPDDGIRFYDPSKNFSVTVFGMYISSSGLQNNPLSADPYEKNAVIEMDGGFGYGGELTFNPRFYDTGILLYLSTEYIKINQDDLALYFDDETNHYVIGMREHLYMTPIEAGIKWPLPINTDLLHVYIGGGAGIYFGDRTRTISYLRSTTNYTRPGFSLNILAGMEYYVARNLSANFELKFREANFDVESKFNSNTIDINGVQFELTNPFYSRLLIDGVRISMGFNYHF